MKALFLLCLLVFPADAGELRIGTWNVLCDICVHPEGFDPWDDRKAEIVDVILEQSPDVLGIQEASTGEQLTYLITNLAGYSVCQGLEADNLHNPIFVKNGIEHECLTGFYVFEFKRSCNQVQIEQVNYYNCHFPLGEQENGIATDEFLANAEEPFVFLGDFNTHREQYPDSHWKLDHYIQTREQFNLSVFFYFWLDIDRIGTSEKSVRVDFERLETGFLSDHRYLEAEFTSFAGFYPILYNYWLND